MYETDIVGFSRRCYYVCLGLIAVLGILFVIIKAGNIQLTEILPWKCSLYTLTGFYCPGCGGTRAVEMLITGHPLQSIKYHPAVPYTVILVACFVISHTLGILSHERIPSMKFRPVYFYIMIGIILVQWLVKNYFWLIHGVHVI